MFKAQALQFFQTHTGLLLTGELDALIALYSVPLSVHFHADDIVLDSFPEVRELLEKHLTHLRDNHVSALKPNIGTIEFGQQKDRCRVPVVWESVSPKGSLLTRADYFFKDSPHEPRIGMIDFAIPVPRRFRNMVLDETDLAEAMGEALEDA